MTQTEAEATAPEAEFEATGRGRLLWCLFVAVGACAILAAFAPLFDPSRLHLNVPFIDQAGYITAARKLADMGELQSGVIYPAYVELPHFRLYMPGHFYCLAASYALFGYGVLQSLLPSLISFVVTSVCCFLIANRLYGKTQGLVAAGIFALFPGSVTYAFTAMAELTFTAAAAVVAAVFVHLPQRARPWLLPVLLALPFLFRETGAFLIIPFALFFVLRGSEDGRRWLRLFCAGAASVLLLWALNRWQIADGKVSVSLSWVTESTFNYSNAFPDPPPEWSFGDWVAGLRENAARNWTETQRQLRERAGELSVIGLQLLVGAYVVCLISAICFRRRRDPLPLGVALLGIFLLVLQYFLYDVRAQKAMRTLLYTTPLLAAGLSGALLPQAFAARLRAAAAKTPNLKRVVLFLFVLLGLGATFASRIVAQRAGQEMRSGDALMDEGSTILDGLQHKDDELLLAHFRMAMQYVVDHYPVPWAFLPDDDATLRLLVEHYGVPHTLVVPYDRIDNYSRELLDEYGLELTKRKVFNNRAYLLLQRR